MSDLFLGARGTRQTREDLDGPVLRRGVLVFQKLGRGVQQLARFMTSSFERLGRET